jgi:hypothetical protein
MTAFEEIAAKARTLAPEELPAFLGQIETVRAVAWSRLSCPVGVAVTEMAGFDDCCLRLPGAETAIPAAFR